MNKININVNFEKRLCKKTGIDLTTGDFNSTKIIFDFDVENGIKVFEMKNPSGNIVMLQEIIDNEVILTAKADVKVIHNEKEYIKYIDLESNEYYYNKDDNELYNSEWELETTITVDDLIKVQKDVSVFTERGQYQFEISLYDGESKLTSAASFLNVEPEQVVVGDDIVIANLPLFDQVMNQLQAALLETDNLDIAVNKVDKETTITLTKKDGTTTTTKIYDGEDGAPGQDGENGATFIPSVNDNGDISWSNDKGLPNPPTKNIKGQPGQDGEDGQDGQDAKINGYNIITLEPGENITFEQQGNKFIINAADGGKIDDVKVNNQTVVQNKVALIDLTSYSKINETVNKMALSIDPTTYIMTLQLKDKNNNVLSTGTVDLPLESVVVNGRYDSTTKKVVLTLQSGSTIEFSVADLISGLQSEITSNNKLSSDLVDDTNNTNKFMSSSEKEKLSGIEEHANNYSLPKADVNVLGGVKVGNNLSIRPDGTLDADVRVISKYGIRRQISSSSPAWERLDQNVGMVANATKDGSSVVNDFDSVYPWNAIKTCNYDVTNDQVSAWIGDPNFRFDGSNGEVLTYIPEFYWKRYVQDGYEYIYISEYELAGFTKSNPFYIGRYKMSEANSKGHSVSGANVSTNKTITQHRNLAKALGTGYGQLDWRYFLIQMLYLVEYATYNSQSALGNGITSLRYTANDKALIAESNTNRIVIASNGGFIVGQQIDVGTSQGGRQIATYRTILEINDYDDGTITGKEVVFDGAPVNIAVGHFLYSCGQNTGQCDSLGMKSGCLINDSKHSIIYRGIEDIFGNVFEWVDGINVKDYQAYINYNPLTYAVDTFTGDYASLGYINASSDGYAKTLGYDINNPLVSLPTSVGGGSTTYMCDYYYRNTGNRTACVGGYYNYGTYAGLWAWHCSGTSSYSVIGRGARLLKYQV